MNLDFFKMRIDAIRDATSRNRWIYATATISAVAQMLAAFNLLFSWLRTFPLSGRPFPKDPVVAELQKAMLRNWVDSHFISIPLLGLKFSITDASVVGSFLLCILSVWLFFSMRRENHLIGQTLTEAQHCGDDLKAYVYLGITGTQIFATVSNNDKPFTTLRTPERDERGVVLKGSVYVLMYLPAIAIFFVLFTDFLSLVLPSAFRSPHEPVGSLAFRDPAGLIEIVIRTLIGIFLGGVTLLNVIKAGSYQQGTRELLREVKDWGQTAASGKLMFLR
jgi:hypothetical protein